MERPLPVWVDADVFGAELGEIDAGDGLAVDDEEDAIAGEEVREDGAGLGTFDDGVERVDDGLEAGEALNLLATTTTGRGCRWWWSGR